MTTESTNGSSASKRKKDRSPAYPYIPLENSIKRAHELYNKEGKHGARFADVASHWGFKATSSGAMQTVAALKQFGLVASESGTAENRVIKLTELAIRILLDEREEQRVRAIQEAAISPKLYKTLREKYGSDLPSDANISSYLKIDLGFNPSVVDGVIKDYKDTISFSKLNSTDTLSGKDEEKLSSEGGQGKDMEPPPAVDPNRNGNPQKQAFAASSLNEREEEHLRAKLAGGRTVRVLFSGTQPTQGEISKLIALLELSKDQYPIEIEDDD